MLTSDLPAMAPPGEKVRAEAPARVVVAVLWLLTVWVLGQVSGSAAIFWWPVAIVGTGVLVSAIMDTDAWFDRWSGALMTLVALSGLLAVVALGILVLRVQPSVPAAVWLLVLVPVGLDWNRVLRLRAGAVMTGPVVMVLLVTDAVRSDAVLGGGSMVLVALAWFGLLSTSLWLLHRDLMGALPRPAPLTPLRNTPAAVGALEFALVAVGAAMAAVVLALLLSPPACLPWQDCDEPDSRGGSGFITVGPDVGREDFSGSAWDWPEPSGGEDPTPLLVGPDGRAYRFDEQRGRYVRAPELDTGAAMAEPDPGGEAEQAPVDDEPASRSWWPWMVAAAVLAAVLLAVAVWWLRRPGGVLVSGATPDWSAAAVRRLEAAGERVGCQRGRDESIMRFAERLAEAPGWTGDSRLVDVGALVSRSLFAPAPLAESQRSWVDAVLDDIEASDQADAREGVVS